MEENLDLMEDNTKYDNTRMTWEKIFNYFEQIFINMSPKLLRNTHIHTTTTTTYYYYYYYYYFSIYE